MALIQDAAGIGTIQDSLVAPRLSISSKKYSKQSRHELLQNLFHKEQMKKDWEKARIGTLRDKMRYYYKRESTIMKNTYRGCQL